MLLNLNEAQQILLNSGIIAIPTETVYGLAAIATDKIAVQKIYKAKNRPTDNPLICHFYDFKQVQKYTNFIPDYVKLLVSKLCPGPISFLVNLPDNSDLKSATRGLNSVIFRIPNHSLTLKLLQKLNIPLAAPSANTSAKFSSTTPQMVIDDLGKKIDGVLDGDCSIIGLESTILDCRQKDSLYILRPGAIGKTELQKVLQDFPKKIQIFEQSLDRTKNSNQITTPGQKYRHYSPETKIIAISTQKIVQTLQNSEANSLKIGILADQNKILELQKKFFQTNLFYLNLGEEINQIAKNFYYNLFLLDQQKLDFAYILTENLDNSSLSLALKNRLQKIISANEI
jgi:L-threonylcarbamoyladenylate synthase